VKQHLSLATSSWSRLKSEGHVISYDNADILPAVFFKDALIVFVILIPSNQHQSCK